MNDHQPLTMNPQPPQTGFTLVEMLVVIAILGILMAMMVPAAGLIMKRAKNSTARGDAGVVAATLMKYRLEYNRWPPLIPANGPNDYLTDKSWVEVMAPPPGAPRTTANFNLIVFFEPGGGAVATNGAYAGAFVDPWGRPFMYRVDADGDGQIESPDPNATQPIPAQVIAWSAGSDGDYTNFANEEKLESWDR